MTMHIVPVRLHRLCNITSDVVGMYAEGVLGHLDAPIGLYRQSQQNNDRGVSKLA